MAEIHCARCGNEPEDEATFVHTWRLVYEPQPESEGRDAPYCPECVDAMESEGLTIVADAEVGERWVPIPRGEG